MIFAYISLIIFFNRVCMLGGAGLSHNLFKNIFCLFSEWSIALAHLSRKTRVKQC